MTLKVEKIAGITQKEISEIIQFSLKDLEIGFTTITDITVINDLSIVKIHVSFLGQKSREEAGMKALDRNRGCLYSEFAKRMTIHKVPELIFKLGDLSERGNKIECIIGEISKQM